MEGTHDARYQDVALDFLALAIRPRPPRVPAGCWRFPRSVPHLLYRHLRVKLLGRCETMGEVHLVWSGRKEGPLPPFLKVMSGYRVKIDSITSLILSPDSTFVLRTQDMHGRVVSF